MSLSNLRSLTAAEYQALNITPIQPPPNKSQTGSPDTRITIALGGWVGTGTMAFTIADQANIDTELTINSTTADILKADITSGGSPKAETTYWTVDMGAGANRTNWQLSYDVADGNTDTGTWVFTKGSGG